MRRLLPILVSCLMTSCGTGFFTGDELLAEVGDYRLYRSDLSGLFAAGMTYEDSLAVLKTYVDAWIVQKAKLIDAENNLSIARRNIEREMDMYRTSLLVYRWENEFLEIRLDTVVTESERRNYYNANPELFKSTESVVVARCIMIDSNSPYLKRLQVIYDSEDLKDNDEIGEICYRSAYRYSDFGMNAVGLSKVASFLKISPSEAEVIFSNRRSYIARDGVYTYLVHLFQKVQPGEVLPYEYAEREIRGRVLESRKKKLLREMENEAVNTAYRNNEVKIFINESK